MTEQEFLKLSEKYLAGNCNAEEEERLRLYKDNITLLDDNWMEEMGDKKEIYARSFNRLRAEMEVEPAKRFSIGFWLKVAGAILLVAGLGALFFNNIQTEASKNHVATSKVNKITPGGNEAYLTRSDGSKVALKDIQIGIVTDTGAAIVNKAKNGLLVYNLNKSTQSKGNRAKLAYNTISTPAGGQYAVVLADGSKVWLNALSSIKFPEVFNGNERKVELQGEAYFEIAKNRAMPFKVISRSQVVEVLGTHFNINAYHDEKSVVTTLLEGSVKLSLTNNHEAKMLKPGQEARVVDHIQISDVNTEQSIAWQNDKFNFSGDDIGVIMRKISRWYNVEVEYQNNITTETFVGTVSKYEDIKRVLASLELTGLVHFKIQERKVIVMK
ncbi:FecR family protein [Pedobacter sp. ok626]|uniref:FecR family protein n=1 Tax=Pedobacter sp. ok626 TaxID=1761882 RepID=UPI00088D5B48|nr:FecR family protein [Pedobacter sp. ok626]SDK00870.1 FecR family protein [Pedobacter sp. ok626]